MKFLISFFILITCLQGNTTPVVRIMADNGSYGTGFFTTPVSLITAGHVCDFGKLSVMLEGQVYKEEARVRSSKYDLCLVTLDKAYPFAVIIPPLPSGSFYNGPNTYIGYPNEVLTVSYSENILYSKCYANDNTCGRTKLNAGPGASGSPIVGADNKLVGVIIETELPSAFNRFETVDNVRDFLETEVLNQEQ